MADLLLEGIDGLVIGDDAAGSVFIMPTDDLHRRLELGNGHRAHAQDLGHQPLLFLVVAAQDVVVGEVHGRGSLGGVGRRVAGTGLTRSAR